MTLPGRLTWLMLVTLSTQVVTTFTCPPGCFCPPHSKNVQCTALDFESIPDAIPEETIELNLNRQRFRDTSLTRRNFTTLPHLERLYIIDCGIESVTVDTFKDLKYLEWLDLSKNNIRFIADYTFRGLNLKHLFLNDNPGVQLSMGAFAGLATSGLYMHNCGLRRLPIDLMTPLNGSLKTLWLHGNNFEAFEEKWLYFFRNLAHIRLEGNAFHCNCELRWFHEFVNQHTTSIFAGRDQPQCQTPSLVRGRNFVELAAEDFRCELPTFQNVDAVFDGKKAKLTCAARGDPAPTLTWIRPDGVTESYFPRADDDGDNSNMGVLFMTDLSMDSKKEGYKCVASNPAGDVTFSLNVVWPVLKAPTPSTPKPTKPPPKINKDTIIRADSLSTQSNRYRNNYAGDDGGVYEYNSERSKQRNNDNSNENSANSNNKSFTAMDIVGAVVGTFLITLLISVTIFHFYFRHRQRTLQEDHHHYSVPYTYPVDVQGCKRDPNTQFVMNEAEENRIKMLNNHNGTECPS